MVSCAPMSTYCIDCGRAGGIYVCEYTGWRRLARRLPVVGWRLRPNGTSRGPLCDKCSGLTI